MTVPEAARDALVDGVAACAVGFVTAGRDRAAGATQLAGLAESDLSVLAAAQQRLGRLSADPDTAAAARRLLQTASGRMEPPDGVGPARDAPSSRSAAGSAAHVPWRRPGTGSS